MPTVGKDAPTPSGMDEDLYRTLRDNVTVVLVRPRFAGNVGAAARAVRSMGFARLAVVNPQVRVDDPRAREMAADAGDLLATVKTYRTTSQAVSSAHIVVGTTRRHGRLRGQRLSPRDLADLLSKEAAFNSVAVLFGPEDAGLTNREISLCHWLVSIPTGVTSRSLNVSHAVTIMCYELSLAFARMTTKRLATAGQLEALFQQMERTLLEAGFLQQENPLRIMLPIRRVFYRAGLDQREIRILRGILRQFDYHIHRERQT